MPVRKMTELLRSVAPQAQCSGREAGLGYEQIKLILSMAPAPGDAAAQSRGEDGAPPPKLVKQVSGRFGMRTKHVAARLRGPTPDVGKLHSVLVPGFTYPAPELYAGSMQLHGAPLCCSYESGP